MKITTITSLLSIVALTVIVSCKTFDPSVFQKKPSVSVKSCQFKEITLNDMTLIVTVEIENHYPITLYLDSIESQIYIDANAVFSTKSVDKLKLPKNSKQIKSFSVTITYEQLIKAVKNYYNEDSIILTVKGNVGFSLPASIKVLQSITVPYTFKQEIPTIKPSIAIANFNINAPSMAELADMARNNKIKINLLDISSLYADLQKLVRGQGVSDRLSAFDLPLTIAFDILIKNNTKARLTGKTLDYNFVLHDSEIAKGKPAIQSEQGVSKINCTTVLSTKNISRGLMTALSQQNIQYSMNGNMLLSAALKNMQFPIPFKIQHNGTIKW